MPALGFLASVGLILLAVLFVADATLEPHSPAIVTSQRTGLPAPQYDNAMKTLHAAPAPAPDMTSQAVLAAQPKSDAPAKIAPAARETRAEAPPKKVRVEASAKKARAEAPRQNNFFAQPADYQRNQFDRFSIKDY